MTLVAAVSELSWKGASEGIQRTVTECLSRVLPEVGAPPLIDIARSRTGTRRCGAGCRASGSAAEQELDRRAGRSARRTTATGTSSAARSRRWDDFPGKHTSPA